MNDSVHRSENIMVQEERKVTSNNKKAEDTFQFYRKYQENSLGKFFSWPVNILEINKHPVRGIAYSPCGSFISALVRHEIEVWNMENLEKFSLFGHSGIVNSLSYSTDGKFLATSSEDKTIKIWNMQEKKEEHSFDTYSYTPLCLSFSLNGKFLAVGSSDSLVSIWSIQDKQEVSYLSGHSYEITSLCYSPDNNFLSAGSEDGCIKIWKISNQIEIANLFNHYEKVTCLAYSVNGDYLVSGSKDKSVKIWELDKFQLKLNLDFQISEITCLSFSHEGTFLAIGSKDGTIKILNFKEFKEEDTLFIDEELLCMDFSSSRRFLVTGSKETSIKVWDLFEGKKMVVNGHYEEVSCLAFSVDGEFVAFGSGSFIRAWRVKGKKEEFSLDCGGMVVTCITFSCDGTVLFAGVFKYLEIWDFKERVKIFRLIGHNDIISDLKCTSDGMFIATASHDESIKIWNLQDLTEDMTLFNRPTQITSLSFSNDDQFLASVSSDNSQIIIWELSTRDEFLIPSKHSDKVTCICYSPNGKLLASGSWDGTIKIWNMEKIKNEENEENILKSYFKVACLAFSSDANFLVAGSEEEFIVKIWNFQDKEEKILCNKGPGRVFSLIFRKDRIFMLSGNDCFSIWNLREDRECFVNFGLSGVTCIEVSRDGELFAGGFNCGTIKVCNFDTKEDKVTLIGNFNTVSRIVLSSDNKYLASLVDNHRLIIWDIILGSEVYSKTYNESINPCLSFSNKKNLLAVGSNNKIIKIFNIEKTSTPMMLNNHRYNILCLSYSKCGHFIATGSTEKLIKIWNIKTKQESLFLYLTSSTSTCLSYSPSGDYLAAGLSDYTLKVWNTKDFQEFYTVKYFSHSITCLKFSSDGRLIATGSSDNSVKIRDFHKNQEKFSIHEHSDNITCLDFSPDDRFLATGSSDRCLKIWDIYEERESVGFNKGLDELNRIIEEKEKMDWEGFKIEENFDGNEEVSSFELNEKCFSFSTDKKFLVTGHDYGIVKVWIVKDEVELICEFKYFSRFETIEKIFFSDDGSKIRFGYEDQLQEVSFIHKLSFIFNYNLKKIIKNQLDVQSLYLFVEDVREDCLINNDSTKSFKFLEKKFIEIISNSLWDHFYSPTIDKAFEIFEFILRFAIHGVYVKYLEPKLMKNLVNLNKFTCLRKKGKFQFNLLILNYLQNFIKNKNIGQKLIMIKELLFERNQFHSENLKNSSSEEIIRILKELPTNCLIRQIEKKNYKIQYIESQLYNQSYFIKKYLLSPGLSLVSKENLRNDLKNNVILHDILKNHQEINHCFCDYFEFIENHNSFGLIFESQGISLKTFINKLKRSGCGTPKSDIEKIVFSLLNTFVIMQKNNIFLTSIKADYFLIDKNHNIKLVNYNHCISLNNLNSESIKNNIEKENIYFLGKIILQLAISRKLNEDMERIAVYFETLRKNGLTWIAKLLEMMLSSNIDDRLTFVGLLDLNFR